MGRLHFVLPFLSLAVMAQDGANAVPRNDHALATAIAGIGKRSVTPAPRPVRIAPPAATACSVPLREMRIDERQHFTSRSLPVSEAEAMPRVALPAPPCESASF